MKPERTTRWLTAGTLLIFTAGALGQAAFTGTGRLVPGNLGRALGVSPDGSIVVGYAAGADGKSQACLWTAGGGLKSLGLLNPSDKESRATDVGITSTGEVKICGYSKDSGDKDQAFLWTGNVDGAGTFFAIPRLSGGTTNTAAALLVMSDDVVFVTGDSGSSAVTGNDRQAYRWRSDSPGGSLALGFLNSTRKNSRATGIALRSGETHIAGYGQSRWSGGNDSREAMHWTPSGGIGGDAGLTQVCGGEGWQILAGPNGVADTKASGLDLQITPVGTTGLDPERVVVSAGADNMLKDQTNAAGDDVLAPASMSPSVNESLYRGVSPDGRFRVGRSNYIPGNNTLWEANLRDIRNRDYSSPDNCGGIAFHWPLGFCTLDNLGMSIADNYSEALGVSNGSGDTSRSGLVVVGSSLNVNEPAPRATRAFICMIQDGPDMWFLRQQGAAPDDYGARVASRFKDMRNLQWLLSYDFQLNLAGWDLREATAVNNNGTVVVGWGLHDGVEEGFVATVPGIPEVGACCNHHTLECAIVYQAACDGEWLGPGTQCTRCCPQPFSDGDTDGDVDMDDFGLFQACINTGVPNTMLPGCSCWDLDQDGTVDDDDFTRAFIICGTGPGIPADPQCQ